MLTPKWRLRISTTPSVSRPQRTAKVVTSHMALPIHRFRALESKMDEQTDKHTHQIESVFTRMRELVEPLQQGSDFQSPFGAAHVDAVDMRMHAKEGEEDSFAPSSSSFSMCAATFLRAFMSSMSSTSARFKPIWRSISCPYLFLPFPFLPTPPCADTGRGKGCKEKRAGFRGRDCRALASPLLLQRGPAFCRDCRALPSPVL